MAVFAGFEGFSWIGKRLRNQFPPPLKILIGFRNVGIPLLSFWAKKH